MNKWYLPMALAACLLTACSDEPDGVPMNAADVYAGTNDWTATLKSSDFWGEWSVNDQIVDKNATNEIAESNMDASYPQKSSMGDISYHYLFSEEGTPRIAFYRFPFIAIARQLFPNVAISGIVTDMRLGTPFTPEEQLLVKTIIDHGDNAYCIEPALSLPLRVVGYSGQTLYCELGGNYRYYPFVVKEPDGNFFAVVLCLTPAATTFVVKPESLNAVITIERIEVVDKDGNKSEMVPKQALTIKFTSKEKKEV